MQPLKSPGCDEAKVFAKLSEGQSDDFSAGMESSFLYTMTVTPFISQAVKKLSGTLLTRWELEWLSMQRPWKSLGVLKFADNSVAPFFLAFICEGLRRFGTGNC